VRGLLWSLFQRRHDHLLDLINRDRWRASGPVLINEPVQALFHEPGTPLGHRGRMHPQIRGDLFVGHTVGTDQHDLAALRQRLRGL
jgi:hypothetical protein